MRASFEDSSAAVIDAPTPSVADFRLPQKPEQIQIIFSPARVGLQSPKFHLLHCDPAVHPQNLSGDVGRGGQERYRPCHLLGLADPAQGNGGQ